jgi:hypothetical protein
VTTGKKSQPASIRLEKSDVLEKFMHASNMTLAKAKQPI